MNKKCIVAAAMAALALTGCGNSRGKVPMGRYVESYLTVPEAADSKNFYDGSVIVSDRGELLMADYSTGLYSSSDGGQTWEKREAAWFDMAKNAGYIGSVALSPDGSAAVVYSVYRDDDEGDDSEGDEAASSGDIMAGIDTKCFWADAEGNIHDIDYDGKGERSLRSFWFDAQGNLYAGDYNFAIYEVDKKSGTLSKLFDTEEIRLADNMCFSGRYILAFGRLGALLFDKERGELADGTVLNSFVTEHQVVKNVNLSGGGHSVISCTKDDGTVYIGIRDGLYKYDIDGGEIVEVIDGAFSAFGDPSSPRFDAACLPGDEFVVLYGGDGVKLCRYSFDESVPSVPDESVTVYSLWENYSMRQAISSYQKKNPGTFIRYEIGLSGDDSVTREDAVRMLNTRLMSDDHPDILILDGLSADAYKAKGILADVDALIDEEIFSNIKEACLEDDGSLYALPLRVQIPLVAGKREDIKGITDIKTFSDAMVRLRSEDQNGQIMGYMYDTDLLHMLGLICDEAWTGADGSLDRDELKEFITIAKRIYDAERAGYTTEELQEYEDERDDAVSNQPFREDISWKSMQFIPDHLKLALGVTCQVDFDYDVLTSVLKEKDGIDFALFEGDDGPLFIPCAMTAVVSGSADDEKVREFYSYIFSRDAQVENENGFPVNKTAFSLLAESPYDDDGGLSCATGDDDGTYITLNVNWPNDDEFKRLQDIMESVGTFCSLDGTVFEIVQKAGVRALSGEMSIEEAVDEMCKKMDIYLAE